MSEQPIIATIDGGDMCGWLTVKVDPKHIEGRKLGDRVGIIFDLPEPEADPLASHPELPFPRHPLMDCPECGKFRGHGHECEPAKP